MTSCRGRAEVTPFTDAEVAELERLLGVRHAAAGSPLLDEATTVERIGIILSGEVELTHRRRGRREVLQVLRAGETYGDVALLCALPTLFGARAASDVRVIELDAAHFLAMLDQRPQACRRVLSSVACRLERTQRRLLTTTASGLTKQVAALLLEEAGSGSGDVALSQGTIADLLGATRPSVNRVLGAFEEAGHLRRHYRCVEVLDAEGLAQELR